MNDARTAQKTTVDRSNSTQVSRRQVLQGALGAASLTLATPSTLRAQRTRGVSVSPQPGTRTASPGTQISFRGTTELDVGALEVRGSKSGAHAGTWIAHSDGAGASFQPDRDFHPGEVVTVRTGLGAAAGDIAEFRFTVSRPLPVSLDPQPTGEEGADQVHAFRSRPDLQPAVIRIDQIEEGLAAGLIFLAPKRGTGLNGAQIIDDRGETVWYFPAGPESEEIYDFRAQQFRGQPVLTWWQGVSAVGQGFGHFVIMDSSYQLVTTVTSGNGYPGADLHEFLITPRDTALFIIYHPIDWQIGVRRPMLDSVVQEVDIETGAVIFEWHSLDHVSVEESHLSIPEDEPDRPFDYFHANSVGEDEDGNLIVSARNTWALYKIDRSTGDVSWRLGGEQSDFRMDEGTETIYQHDARAWANGELTIFDNGGGPPEVHERSRGIRVSLDLETMTATLVAEYVHPIRILAYTQGNMQKLSNGNVFISWGDEQYMSEYSADGEHLQDWVLPKAKQTYRAYRLPWAGQPLDEPTIAVERKANGEVTIFASWNGATDVADWRVLAGADPGDVTEVARIRRTGFETELGAGPDARYVAVEGLDAAGAMLGRSSTAEVPRADLAAAIKR